MLIAGIKTRDRIVWALIRIMSTIENQAIFTLAFSSFVLMGGSARAAFKPSKFLPAEMNFLTSASLKSDS